MKIVSLSILTLASIGLLAGCGKAPEVVSETAPVMKVEEQQQPRAVVATTTEEKIDLDAETKALDETMKEVEKSGFEQTDLTDKDLGLQSH